MRTLEGKCKVIYLFPPHSPVAFSDLCLCILITVDGQDPGCSHAVADRYSKSCGDVSALTPAHSVGDKWTGAMCGV